MADLYNTTVKQKKGREETESGGEIKRFGQNPVCPLASPFACLSLVSSRFLFVVSTR